MYVSPVKQIFKCFACSAGGDVFKFIQLRENISFPEAVERLADRAGIQLERVEQRPQRHYEDGQQYEEGEYYEEEQSASPADIARVNDWAVRYWKKNLQDAQKGQNARQYLEERGLTSETIESWSLCLALDSWDGLLSAARQRGIGVELLESAGLVSSNNEGRIYDKFRNRLMFPIADATGRMIAFGGRTLGDDPAKYMNSPTTVLFDKSNSIFGLDKARHEIVSSGKAVVVEGYTDVIMAHQFGCSNVVATLGTSFTSGHVRLLRRYAKCIVLLFDNDVAGAAAANRALEVCLSEKVDIKIAFVTQGKDPCDFLLAAGADAFRDLVSNAIEVMEFKWKRLIDGMAGGDNLADKKIVIEDYLRSVALAVKGRKRDAIAEGLISARLSEITGLSSEQIRNELARLSRQASRGDKYQVKNRKVVSFNLGKGYYATAQRELLEVLLNAPELFAQVQGKITVEDFDVAILREIADVLFEMLSEGEEPKAASISVRLETVQASSAMLELADTGQKKGQGQDVLKGALDAFERYKHERRKMEIKAETVSGRSDDETSLQRIHEMLKSKGNVSGSKPGMSSV